MTLTDLDPVAPVVTGRPHRLRVRRLEQRIGGRTAVHGVDLTVDAGEVVAIAGGSGAGKTTLLEAMAGVRRPAGGTVEVDGVDRAGAGPRNMGAGYVPQDDIVHAALPLERTLRHAARLRLPEVIAAAEVERLVAEVLARLGLDHRRDVAVGDLSGGERKRASVAVELLSRPPILFLDEPTSGLDPASSADLLQHLHHLGDEGAAVVLTTHAPADLDRCDRVVFLGNDGRVAFVGTPVEARRHFGVDDLVDVYALLAAAGTGRRPTVPAPPEAPRRAVRRLPAAGPAAPGALRQWTALVRRTADLLTRDHLSLAVLLGSPVAVTAMMAAMFQPGALAPGTAGAAPAVQTVYWLGFAGFFFGLTSGLLQIVVELPIVRRDRLAGMRPGCYVAAKVAVLAPVLVVVSAAMLAVLRVLDRLPALSWSSWLELELTLVLTSVAALSTGLLASAAVTDGTQATLALPMLCFPQVLFAGALVPSSEMAAVGRWAGGALVDRWAFEALGRVLHLQDALGAELAAAGYGQTFAGPPVRAWVVLAVIAAVGGVATAAVLARRTVAGRR